MTLEAHNFLCRPLIEVRSKTKLYPSFKTFHRYVARHLHASKSTRFLTFGHNLCFKYPNGSCKTILDIYVPRAFQCYIELFNPMNFDPVIIFWKFRSPSTPTSKVRTHLGVCGSIPSHFPTFPRAWNVTFRLHSQLTPSQALALVASPKLGLRHFPLLKEKVNVLIDM